jgi:hypothetical protein
MQKVMIIIGLVFFFFIGGGTPSESQAQVVVKIKPMGGRVLKTRPTAQKGKVWIPAHWKYSNKHRKYVWKTGRWSKAKKGHRYVEGHWKKVSGGHKYVPGYWKRR